MLLLMNFLFFLPLTMFLGTLLLSNIRRYYLVCHYGLLVRVDTTTPPLEECPVLTTANPDNVGKSKSQSCGCLSAPSKGQLVAAFLTSFIRNDRNSTNIRCVRGLGRSSR